MKSFKLKALVAAGVIISAVQPAEARHYPHYAPPAHVSHVSYISPPFFSISYGNYGYQRPHHYVSHYKPWRRPYWGHHNYNRPPHHGGHYGHRDRGGVSRYVHHKR